MQIARYQHPLRNAVTMGSRSSQRPNPQHALSWTEIDAQQCAAKQKRWRRVAGPAAALLLAGATYFTGEKPLIVALSSVLGAGAGATVGNIGAAIKHNRFPDWRKPQKTQ